MIQRHSPTLFLASVLAFCCCLPASAQNLNECELSDMLVDSGDSGTSTFEVVPDVTLAEVNIRLTVTTTFTGYIESIDVTSPSGTIVRLHDGNNSSANSGGWGDDIDVTYSDNGRDNGLGLSTPATSVASGSPYDCGGCPFKPFSLVDDPDDELSAFDGEDSVGDWELNITNGSFTNSTLNHWCVINYPTSAVSDLTCSAGDLAGELVLTWTNDDDYERIDVYIAGEVVASETIDTEAGLEVTLEVDSLATPQLAYVDVRGVVLDSDTLEELLGPSSYCDQWLPAEPIDSIGEIDVDASYDEFSPFVGLDSFSEDFVVEDVQVRISASGDWIAYNDAGFWLTSASGTTVSIVGNFSGSTNDSVIDAVFSDVAPNRICDGDGGKLDCDGGLYRSREKLREFAGESTFNDDGDGTWAFFAYNSFSECILTTWWVDAHDRVPALPPELLSCEQTDEIGAFEIVFEPGSDYSSARILIDGIWVDTIEPNAPDTVLAAEVPVTWNSSTDGEIDNFDLPDEVHIAIVGFNDAAEPAPGAPVECRVRFFVPGLESIVCESASGSGSFDVRWGNGYDYDGIDVSINGVFVETLSGTTEEYLDRDTDAAGTELTVPSTVEISLAPFVSAASGDVYGPTGSCFAMLLPAVDIEACSDGGPDVLTSEVTVDDVSTIEEVEALTTITTNWEAGCDIDLTSPAGTQVRLKDYGGSTSKLRQIVVLWDDDGEITTDFQCACRVRPQGTDLSGFGDTLSDFVNERTDGNWSLTIADTNASFFGNPSNIDHWCLRLDACEILAPSDLVAESEGSTDPYDVELSWTNNDDYRELDGIEIYELSDPDAPLLVATVSGPSETVLLEDVGAGRFRYRVRAYHPDDPGGCYVETDLVRIEVGFLTTCALDDGVSPEEIDTDPTFEDTINVSSGAQIAEAAVVFTWSSSFSPTRAEVLSPAGTEVELIDTQIYLQASGEVLDCVFDDDGTALLSSDPTNNDGFEKAPVGQLSDLAFENSGGDWTLSGASSTFYAATLDDWCVSLVEGCTAEPPGDIVCTWQGGLDLALEWVNAGTYDTIYIDVDGVEVAEVDGDEESATVVLAIAGVVQVRLRAYDAVLDCTSGSQFCEAVVGLINFCDLEPDDNELPALVDASEFNIDIVDGPEFEEVECLVDFSTPFIDSWELSLENPDGESVLLFDQLGDDGDGEGRLFTVFSDRGIPNNFATADGDYSAGIRLQPHELTNGAFGALADLVGDSADGEWTLEVNNVTGFYAGTLDTWCVRLLEGCPIEPITDLRCETLFGGYPIALSWTNNDPDSEYTEITIFSNGVPIRTVDGSEEETTITDGPGGQLTFEFSIYNEDNDCFKPSRSSCTALVGQYRKCATDDLNWQDLTIEGGINDLGISILEWADSDLEAVDGTTDDDLSPTEDDRVDIDDVAIAFSISTTWVGDWRIHLASPEGTVLTLWDQAGGEVEWDAEDAVLISDFGQPAPAVVPDECNESDCFYSPPIASLSDLRAEDALGDWILIAQSSYEGTVNDWCVVVFPDEYGTRDRYIRGDVNGDGNVLAITDGLYALRATFGDEDVEIPCYEAADVDGNGSFSAIIDTLRLLQHFFGDADAPPQPFPDCGRAVPGYEYTGTEISCENTLGCW